MITEEPSDQVVPYLHQPSRSCNRSKGLKKLGVSEHDVHLAEKILVPSCPTDPNRAAREKALRMLGTTEEELQVENSKILGSLGIAGRRRSYSIIDANQSEILTLTKALPRARASTMVSKLRRASDSGSILRRRTTRNAVKRQLRRRSSDSWSSLSDTEIRRLRNQARSDAMEIQALRSRVDELEKRLASQPPPPPPKEAPTLIEG